MGCGRSGSMITLLCQVCKLRTENDGDYMMKYIVALSYAGGAVTVTTENIRGEKTLHINIKNLVAKHGVKVFKSQAHKYRRKK